MIAGARRFLSRLWKAITALLQPVWRFITRWTTTGKVAVVSFAQGVRERHVRRMDTDASYPVAIAAGSTAVFGVLAASPAIAASIGVLVSELLGSNNRRGAHHSRSSAYGRRSWEEERESQKLWERNDWDEE